MSSAFLQIGPGRKGALLRIVPGGAGDDDAAERHVEIGLADHLGERRQEVRVETVHRLGAVQSQDQDPLFRSLLQENLQPCHPPHGSLNLQVAPDRLSDGDAECDLEGPGEPVPRLGKGDDAVVEEKRPGVEGVPLLVVAFPHLPAEARHLLFIRSLRTSVH